MAQDDRYSIRNLNDIKFEKVSYDYSDEKDLKIDKEAVNNVDIDKKQQSKNYVTAKNLNDLKNTLNNLIDVVSGITLYLSNIDQNNLNNNNSKYNGYKIIDFIPSNGISELSGNLTIDLSNFMQKNQIEVDGNIIGDSIRNLDDFYLKLKNFTIDSEQIDPTSSYNLISLSSAQTYITSSTIIGYQYLTSVMYEEMVTKDEFSPVSTNFCSGIMYENDTQLYQVDITTNSHIIKLPSISSIVSTIVENNTTSIIEQNTTNIIKNINNTFIEDVENRNIFPFKSDVNLGNLRLDWNNAIDIPSPNVFYQAESAGIIIMRGKHGQAGVYSMPTSVENESSYPTTNSLIGMHTTDYTTDSIVNIFTIVMSGDYYVVNEDFTGPGADLYFKRFIPFKNI